MGPSRSHGASIRSCRNAARKVVVFQRRCGTLAVSLRPRGAHPRSGAILVLVHVSSMKTRRSGSMRARYFVHCARRLATSGRSRSPATTLFFEAELLGMDELPYRTVVNLQPALSKLGDQAAQGEVSLSSFEHPDAMFTGNRLRPVAAHLPWCHAAGLVLPAHPANGCADRNPELSSRLIARQTAGQNRPNNPLPKILRVRLAHLCWPPPSQH